MGTQLIREIVISVGGHILQKFSGQYLYNLVERDFTEGKKKLYYEMTGNTADLNDPANATNYRQDHKPNNTYPNAYYNGPLNSTTNLGPEPSIRARKLYIPINAWFTLMSKMAFPLISLQYNYLNIQVIMRPIKELFQIRDVLDGPNNFPYIQPDFNNAYYQFYRFLQPPPDISLNTESYTDKRTLWDADIHMLSTYAFLSKTENRLFAKNTQKYLIKDIYETKFYNVAGTQKLELHSLGMIANWSFVLQRNDVYRRNEWSNYSNWAYDYLPHDISLAEASGNWVIPGAPCHPSHPYTGIGPGMNWNISDASWSNTNLYTTPTYNTENEKNILTTLGILFDGKYRENTMAGGIYNYIDKYVRSSGNGPDGLYFYNFGLQTNPLDFQPTGAVNLSKFSKIELEINTIPPPLDPSAQFYTVCDQGGDLIGVNKQNWEIYKYNYDFILFEERYNVVTFVGGNAGLMYAR